jgi:hypothetical protein
VKPATAVLLAWPTAAADRGRVALIAAATAVAGAFLLAAVRIARFSGRDDGGGDGLARYVTEPGLRPGVAVAVGLLVVPVLALGVQALRVGSVARDRRMASLRLAGATPRAVRAVAAAEAGGAALAGGLAAGPAYLALWVLLGVLPPGGLALLPAPTPVDAVAWAGVALLAAVGGALAGAAVQGRVVVEALGVRRRASSNRPGRLNPAVLVTGGVLVVAGTVGPVVEARAGAMAIYIMMVGILLSAFAVGPRLVGLSGRLLSRRAGAEALLAGARLTADPRSSGRVAAVLVICGVALGVDAGLAVDFLTQRESTDEGFYLTGFALVALGVLVGACVAVLTLLVGAADGLLDARRPLATLTALGVDQPLLSRVLARQLAAVAVPAVVVGVLIGGGMPALPFLLVDPTGRAILTVVFTVATAVVAGLAAFVAARLTARLLRAHVRAATDPENLRVA